MPPGWLGVVADGPLLEPGVDLEAELDAMAAAGVESVRFSVYWYRAQPSESGPLELAGIDRIVTGAAARGIGVLPVVLWAPRWARLRPDRITSPPRPAAYGAFLAALARRYGRGGSLWRERPDLFARPVREWQAWNEPTIAGFWSDQPFARRYAALLRAARPAIRAVDPEARIVLGGLVYDSWSALKELYRAGARGAFDAVALHPFTDKLSNLVTILERARRVMERNGDARLPLEVTELSWPSSRGRTEVSFGYETTERGQALRLSRALERLARERRRLRLAHVYWYTWLSADRGDYPFSYAGLRRAGPDGVEPKPAFEAFRSAALALEGRRRDG